ncbi:hypothetical protein WDT62_23555 [Klebsiella pneumoniae]|jgi:hypothetical protein|uniref:Uncharacterized protein n=9 Tax=Klebsiella pneumoniae TaxID=573 RepID=A0A4S4V2F8_KLEPN|nr:hypothetical protein [Klebsiella pneumoniae]EIV9760744.1 hypothetical protein [Klebsiella pneumoniae]EIW0144328.1 hypothetical protein [Klebsiella pneumoniae]EIW0569551.1 hypothetical protein [Klebsiella pneumoniae]EIW0587933.1 hypothetical protein [Klebsiella pneumoniae]EIW0614746.1 hypothetical protein [Klebsiella pneumoniae]
MSQLTISSIKWLNVKIESKLRFIAYFIKLLCISILFLSHGAFANKVFCSSLMFIEDGSRARVSLITPLFESNDPATGFYAESGVLRDKWRSYLRSSMKGMHANEAGCMNASEYGDWIMQLKNTGDPIQIVKWPLKSSIHADKQGASGEGEIASTTQLHTKKNKKERQWVDGVNKQCVANYNENGYLFFVNKCTFPVLVSYCIKQPIEEHKYLKCQAQKSGASRVGINYTRATLEVPPGGSVSAGGTQTDDTELYIYLACRTDQIPVMYRPSENGEKYTVECLVTQN